MDVLFAVPTFSGIAVACHVHVAGIRDGQINHVGRLASAVVDVDNVRHIAYLALKFVLQRAANGHKILGGLNLQAVLAKVDVQAGWRACVSFEAERARFCTLSALTTLVKYV